VAFEQWHVVVAPFPFSDGPARRRRPALVLSRSDALGNVIGHSVLAMITSAGHRRWPLDVPLADLSAAGLPAPSMVRLKILTLDGRLVERRVGALGPPDESAVQGALGRLFGGLGG
jgi:mRNA interferase MazF